MSYVNALDSVPARSIRLATWIQESALQFILQELGVNRKGFRVQDRRATWVQDPGFGVRVSGFRVW